MPQQTFAFVPLVITVLALLSQGKAFAGPPEGVSGKMVFEDRVATWLRKFREETNPKEVGCNELIALLEATRDPRVAVALGETLDSPDKEEARLALIGLGRHCLHLPPWADDLQPEKVRKWWKAHEADLRRRAKQLPE